MSGFCTVSDFSVELKMELSVAGNLLGRDNVTDKSLGLDLLSALFLVLHF